MAGHSKHTAFACASRLALAGPRSPSGWKKNELAIKNLKELVEEFPGNTTYETEYAKALGRPIPATMGPAQ